jgi:RND family efflux transporter MFP subunit
MSQTVDHNPQPAAEGSNGAGRSIGQMMVSRSSRATMTKQVLVPLAVALVVGAFYLGRHTAAPPSGTADAHAGSLLSAEGQDPQEQSKDQGHEPDEKGVIKFTPEALARAGLHVQPVAVTTVRSFLPATGTVQPNLAGMVKVTPRVAGKITSLQANIGNTFRAGQVLATMTSTELAQAQSQYQQASARVAAAKANLQRQQQLAGFGEFGQHKVQEARGNFAAAQGDVNEVQAEINAVRNEVAQAQAALAAAQGDEASTRSDVAAAETAVDQAKTQVEVMQSRFNRQEILFKEELTSRQDWEQARADLKKAQADVLTAEATLRSAHAKVDTARAKVDQAGDAIGTQQAHLQQSQAKREAALQRLTIARQALAREERIFRSGVLTSKEIAGAEATLRQAEIDRTAAANAVRLLGATPGAGDTLAITAPLSGRVTERAVTIGETVSPEKSLFTLLNLRSVWVQLAVYQRDLPSIRVGAPVTLSTDAIPGKTLTGTVASIGDVLDETTRTVKVRCVTLNPGDRLKPEMFVRGRIALPSAIRGISVPQDAIQTEEGKTVVYTQGEREGEFVAKPVQTGERTEGRVLITAGLKPGERIVTRGAFMVKAQAMKSELTEE